MNVFLSVYLVQMRTNVVAAKTVRLLQQKVWQVQIEFHLKVNRHLNDNKGPIDFNLNKFSSL